MIPCAQERESLELKRRLASYEHSNPSTARSNASDDDNKTHILDYTVPELFLFEHSDAFVQLLEVDRGFLDQKLGEKDEEIEMLSSQLREVRAELLKAKTKLRSLKPKHLDDDDFQPPVGKVHHRRRALN